MRVVITESYDKKGFFTVTPHGDINSDTHAQLKEKLAPILVKSTKGILLDLSEVNYISSAGLGELFSLKKFLTENGGDLLFIHVKPQIKKLFDIVKVLPKESLFVNEQEADNYFYEIMKKEIERNKE